MFARISPHVFGIFIIVMTLAIIFTFWISNIEDFRGYVPSWLFRVEITIYLAALFLWPLDLLVHWERFSGGSVLKDRILLIVLVTIILYVFPVYWYGILPFRAAVFAVSVGLVGPTIVLTIHRWQKQKPVISSRAVVEGGSRSPQAERFLSRFPEATRIVYGLSHSEGDSAHLLLHKRLPLESDKNAGIDLVMDVRVSRETGEFQEKRERLYCYLFLNRGDTAGVGLLPSANIGRALDYGFSDEEMEDAMNNALASEAKWPSISDLPLQAQLHRGPVYRV